MIDNDHWDVSLIIRRVEIIDYFQVTQNQQIFTTTTIAAATDEYTLSFEISVNSSTRSQVKGKSDKWLPVGYSS